MSAFCPIPAVADAHIPSPTLMLPPDAEVNYQELVKDFGMLAPLDRDAKDIARLSMDEKLYIAAIERRGESIEGNPRIKLSTIHAMKGVFFFMFGGPPCSSR